MQNKKALKIFVFWGNRVGEYVNAQSVGVPQQYAFEILFKHLPAIRYLARNHLTHYFGIALSLSRLIFQITEFL